MIFSTKHDRTNRSGHKILVFETQEAHDEYFRDYILCLLSNGVWDYSNRDILYIVKSRALRVSPESPTVWSGAYFMPGPWGGMIWSSNDVYPTSDKALQAAIDQILEMAERRKW